MAVSTHGRKTALHSPQFQLKPIETAGRERVSGRRRRHSHSKISLFYVEIHEELRRPAPRNAALQQC